MSDGYYTSLELANRADGLRATQPDEAAELYLQAAALALVEARNVDSVYLRGELAASSATLYLRAGRPQIVETVTCEFLASELEEVARVQLRSLLRCAWDQMKAHRSATSDVSFEEILAAVSARVDVSIRAMHGRGRHTDTVRARTAAIFLARELTPLSSPKIGAKLGRDHSTILAAVTRAQKLLINDRTFAGIIDDVRADLTTRAHIGARTNDVTS